MSSEHLPSVAGLHGVASLAHYDWDRLPPIYQLNASVASQCGKQRRIAFAVLTAESLRMRSIPNFGIALGQFLYVRTAVFPVVPLLQRFGQELNAQRMSDHQVDPAGIGEPLDGGQELGSGGIRVQFEYLRLKFSGELRRQTLGKLMPMGKAKCSGQCGA